jgi:hypothetical protein
VFEPCAEEDPALEVLGEPGAGGTTAVACHLWVNRPHFG